MTVPENSYGLELCIDGVPLLFRSAGVKNYLHHWIVNLQQAGSPAGLHLKVFPYLRVPRELNHERSVCGPLGTLSRLALWHIANTGTNRLLDWVVPKADIFHVTRIFNPPHRPCLTATLHDATAWLTPELHTAANVAADKLVADRIWKHAAGLIAVSECTRLDAVRLLGLDPQRIQVIHHGVPDPYFSAGPEAAAHARSRYDLPQNYVLCVGTIEPRKNISVLLDAWESLSSEVRCEFRLVFAGPVGWSSAGLVERLKAAGPDVRYLGYVPEHLMPGLFAGASLFAYVSLYEGFGFPVAQALAAGVPVLTSALSALPEVAGDAAEFVDPRSVDAVRTALLRLLTSRSRRSELAAVARRRAPHFRWERCARESLRFFEQVAGGGRA